MKKTLFLFLTLVLCIGLAAPSLVASAAGAAFGPENVTLAGGAYYDEKEGIYVLTEEKTWQSGGLWFTQVRCNSNFSLSLEFYTGHADHYDSYGGADGICVCFYTEEGDPSNRRLGFEGGGGYAVEIDTYQNTSDGDPEYNHIAIVEEKISNHLQLADASAFTEDGQWHKLKVQNRHNICTVYVDDVQVLQQGDVTPNGHYAIGIAAATGGGYNYHAVRNIQLTEAVWEDASTWADDELERAQEYGLIPEILEGSDLTQPITRLEFAAVAVKTYEKLAGTAALPATINPFTDCNDTEMLKAYNLGVTNGVSATQFGPASLLNREQAAAMLTRVFKRATMPGWTLAGDASFPLAYTMPAPFADDAQISGWARDSVYFMSANNIINGGSGNKFMPKNTTTEEEARGYANATREQALAIAVRMVENLKG